MPSKPIIPAPGSILADTNQLKPPELFNGVLNVLGAEMGGGIRHIENYMHVFIPKWDPVEEFDNFRFYMRDSMHPLASADVLPGQTDQSSYVLAIPQELVPECFSCPCFSIVQRAGSGTEIRSSDATWFIKSTRPGGSDMGHPMFHPALKLSLPEDLSRPGAVLDPERASKGVICGIELYPNARERDTVELYWDGKLVTLKLDEDHVDGTTAIKVKVPKEIVEASTSGSIIIRFCLEDEVENRSGPDRRWSQAVHLDSDLEPGLLKRPFFVLNGHEIFDVNFDTQSSGHFEVEVVAPSLLPDGSTTPAGTQILVTLSGLRSDATPLIVAFPPFPARIGRSASVDVDNAILEELINGTMRISYELQFPLGTTLAHSRRVAVTIFGTYSNMPAPTIIENEGGLINPEATSITVGFPDYEPYSRNYNVTVRMEATGHGGDAVFNEETKLAGGPPPEPRTFEREFFERFIGLGNVKVFYRVDDGGIKGTDVGTLRKRDSEPLYVRFGEAVAHLPAPEIEGTDEFGNLDPDLIFGSVKVTLPYTGTLEEDKVTWIWTGTGGSGGSTRDSIRVNSGTAGAPLKFNVDKTFVENNRDGEIRLRYYLEREDTDTLYSFDLVVSVGKALGELGAPEVLLATKNPDQLDPEVVPQGATIRVAFEEMTPSYRIRAEWRGLANIGTHKETKDGDISKVLDFAVPKEVVGANIHPLGRDIEVQFFLILGGLDIPSKILHLRLLTLTNKPVPLIDGIGNVPVLELYNLSNTARTRTAPWLFSHRDQRVWMTYSGTFAASNGGGPFFNQTYNADRLGEVDEVAGLSPPAPVDKLQQLADGSTLTIKVMASFDRSLDDSNAVTMDIKQYQIQALPGILPHPTLVGANGTGQTVSVDPLSIEHNRAVNVSFLPMYQRDIITLQWIHRDGVTPPIESQNGLDGGTVVFPIALEILARSVNSQVQLRYSLVRDGHTVESHIQTVNVGTIPSSSLPAPVLNNQTGGILDLTQFTGNALASVGKWPLSAAGTYAQRVWLICTSPDAAEPLYILRNHPINATQQANGLQNIAVPRAWLQGLKYGSALTVTCKVTYDGSSVESSATPFPLAHFTVRPGLLNDMTDFNNSNLNGWAPLHTMVPIHIGRSGSEYYIFTTHNAYMGCHKTFANAGPGVYEVTVRYRHSPRTSGNYVYLNAVSIKYFTAEAGANWSSTTQGPLISTTDKAQFAIRFENSQVQISSIQVKQISRS